MTPAKCARHELQPGELADSARYMRAMRESASCWRCRAIAVVARLLWALGGARRWERQTATCPAGLDDGDDACPYAGGACPVHR
jgi:hypothetical protein